MGPAKASRRQEIKIVTFEMSLLHHMMAYSLTRRGDTSSRSRRETLCERPPEGKLHERSLWVSDSVLSSLRGPSAQGLGPASATRINNAVDIVHTNKASRICDGLLANRRRERVGHVLKGKTYTSPNIPQVCLSCVYRSDTRGAREADVVD